MIVDLEWIQFLYNYEIDVLNGMVLLKFLKYFLDTLKVEVFKKQPMKDMN